MNSSRAEAVASAPAASSNSCQPCYKQINTETKDLKHSALYFCSWYTMRALLLLCSLPNRTFRGFCSFCFETKQYRYGAKKTDLPAPLTDNAQFAAMCRGNPKFFCNYKSDSRSMRKHVVGHLAVVGCPCGMFYHHNSDEVLRRHIRKSHCGESTCTIRYNDKEFRYIVVDRESFPWMISFLEAQGVLSASAEVCREVFDSVLSRFNLYSDHFSSYPDLVAHFNTLSYTQFSRSGANTSLFGLLDEESASSPKQKRSQITHSSKSRSKRVRTATAPPPPPPPPSSLPSPPSSPSLLLSPELTTPSITPLTISLNPLNSNDIISIASRQQTISNDDGISSTFGSCVEVTRRHLENSLLYSRPVYNPATSDITPWSSPDLLSVTPSPHFPVTSNDSPCSTPGSIYNPTKSNITPWSSPDLLRVTPSPHFPVTSDVSPCPTPELLRVTPSPTFSVPLALQNCDPSSRINAKIEEELHNELSAIASEIVPVSTEGYGCGESFEWMGRFDTECDRMECHRRVNILLAQLKHHQNLLYQKDRSSLT